MENILQKFKQINWKSFLNNLKKNWFNIILTIVILWALFVFLIYPNVNIVIQAFQKDGKFSFYAVEQIIHSKRALKGLKNSFLLAVTLSITVNIVGIFIVLVSEYFEIKGSKILKAGYMSTFIYGGIVLVSGYIFVYGETGMLTRMIQGVFPNYTASWFSGYFGVSFVMTFSVTSNHMIFLKNALKKIDGHTIEASRNLGASTFKTLFKVVLPVLMPTIFAVTVLVFLSGLGAYAAPVLIGGDNFQTINPVIRALVYDSPGVSIMLSIILGLMAILLLTIFTWIEKRGTYYSVSKTKGAFKKQKIENKVVNVIVHFFAYLIFLIYVLPIVFIVLFSFTDAATIASGKLSFTSFTLTNYIDVLTDFANLKPFFNSVRFAFTAAIIVVFLVLFLIILKFKHKNILTKIMSYVLLIPWLLPSTIIALGLIQTFNQPQPLIFGMVLVGSTAILVIGYIINKIPFTNRMLNAIYYTIDGTYEKASKSLGARGFYTFRRVTLPMVLPTVIALIAINFNSLITDYNTTIFLYHPLYKTLGIDIKNKTDIMVGGQSQVILLVYTVILMLFAGLILYIAYGKLLKKTEK